MPTLRPLDPSFPIERQLAVDAAPVMLFNVFTLDKADEHTFLQAWQDDAVFMKRQPGFIATQLQADKPLTDTVLAMARDGLLRKVGPGRYTV